MTINASGVTLVPEEVEKWVSFVESELADWKLRYTPSQLTEVLRYHDGYDHENSNLMAYEDEPIESERIEFDIERISRISKRSRSERDYSVIERSARRPSQLRALA